MRVSEGSCSVNCQTRDLLAYLYALINQPIQDTITDKSDSQSLFYETYLTFNKYLFVILLDNLYLFAISLPSISILIKNSRAI